MHSVFMLSSVCLIAWLFNTLCSLPADLYPRLPLRIVGAESVALRRCLIRASERS